MLPGYSHIFKYMNNLCIHNILPLCIHKHIYSDISIVPHTPMYMSTHPHIHAHIMQSPSRHPLRNKNPNLIVNKPMENYRTKGKPEELSMKQKTKLYRLNN